MELSEYGRIFRHRWVLILISAVVGVVVAGLASILSPRNYEAQATLFIRADSEASSSFENSQFVLQRVKSYPDLVHSPQVLTPVLQEMNSSMTLTEIRDRVSASNPEETVYVDVLGSAESPEDAATLANAVAENLRDVIRQLEGGDTTRNAAVEAFVTVPAIAPAEPSSPAPLLNLAIGLLAGGALGLVGALVLGAGLRRVRSGRDLPDSVEFLGSVTGAPSRASGSLAPHTVRQYREVMTRLLVGHGGRIPQLLLITSVGPSDQVQATFSETLAGFIVDSGPSVCLIDATTRDRPEGARPGLDGNVLGFSDVLVGEATLDDVVSPAASGVHRIPIGASGEKIARARAAREAAGVLEQLQGTFDVTVVRTSHDSHPLTTWAVAPVAVAALILVTHGTTEADLGDSLRELTVVGVHPLGVVLSGGPERSGRRGSERAHVMVRTSGRD